jgi:hypothetical protein
MSFSLLVSEHIRENIHFHVAAGLGTMTTALSPIEDWFSRMALGVVVGVSVWAITKSISYLIEKIK